MTLVESRMLGDVGLSGLGLSEHRVGRFAGQVSGMLAWGRRGDGWHVRPAVPYPELSARPR